jgi:N-acetylmuramoyl-L-alanine amidase
MAAYSERHYGEHTWRLRHPRVIVEHWAEAGTAASVYNTFAPDHPDPELHELPNVCSHFVVSGSGRIYQLVSTRVRCRHTVGLNWTAIGIEHTGFSDAEVLGNRREMHASLALTQYLRCRFQIKLRNVIGHAESLSSPYHRERVASLRNQTHGDWRHASMQVYRRRLRSLGRCWILSARVPALSDPGHYLRPEAQQENSRNDCSDDDPIALRDLPVEKVAAER